MTKINLTKYGFVRLPERDFSDDGTRFTAYKVGNRVLVTKAVDSDYAYISARIDGSILQYDEYSKLPHFKYLDTLNGIKKELITDLVLENLYKFCLKYEQEYEELEQGVKFPTLEEIRLQILRIRTKRSRELEEITQVLKEKAATFLVNASQFDLQWFKDRYQQLVKKTKWYDLGTYPESIQKSAYGRNFVSPDFYELKDSFEYKQLIEMLEKY